MSGNSTRKILLQALPIMSLAVLLEILGGQLINSYRSFFYIFPVYLAMVPPLNGMGGNIGSVLGARLSSGLHVGYIDISFKDKELRTNILSTLFVGASTYTILAVFILVISPMFGFSLSANEAVSAFGVLLCTGLLLVVTLVAVSATLSLYSFKKGLDPDNVVSPLVTSIGDIFGIIFLILMMVVFGI